MGRSRRSDIRVGHKLPVPYISSRNFRLTHALCWPESLGAPAGAAAPALDGADGGGTPWVQAYLEDLSQNGTYVNGQRVESGRRVALEPGDVIELVFARSAGQQGPPAGAMAECTWFEFAAPGPT